jgi:hypothetical protein
MSMDYPTTLTLSDRYSNGGFGGGAGYRLCNDGTYAYIAYFSNPGTVAKFRLSDGTMAGTWQVGSLLNAIAFDGQYIWTVGDNHNVDVTNPSGVLITTLSGVGRSDVVIGGGYAWTVDWGTPPASTINRNNVSYPSIISGIKNGYSLNIYDSNGNPFGQYVTGVDYNLNIGYLSGTLSSGLYVLTFNGYVAAKQIFNSGLSTNNSLLIV